MENLLPFERIKRSILVRKEAETSEKYGADPLKRSMAEMLDFGIININKPPGPTSHQVSAYVQKILGIDKSGHSGTLDPKVTGVLPIAIGSATRIVQVLLTSGKEYVACMHLHKGVSEADIMKVVKKFTGKIKQMPPIKSAVKRQWRLREIYYLEVMEIGGQDVLFRVGCQAGTYIRKLIHDMGQSLKVGAHMSDLIRTKAGGFSDKDMATLHDLADAYHYYKEGNEKYLRKLLLPIEAGVAHLPKVWVLDTTAESLCHGASLAVPGVAKVESDIQVDETVAVMTLKDELICLGTTRMISKQMLGKKGIAVKTNKVFMKAGVYPKVTVR